MFRPAPAFIMLTGTDGSPVVVATDMIVFVGKSTDVIVGAQVALKTGMAAAVQEPPSEIFAMLSPKVN